MSTTEEKATTATEEPKTEAPEVTEDPGASEFDPIMPELIAGGTITLAEREIQLPRKNSPGVTCKLNPVRTRQLLQIGRILTGSTRPVNLHAILAPLFTAETNDEQWAAGVAGFLNLVVAVPHSEQEFINLLSGIVLPVEDNMSNDQMTQFFNYMSNPDPEDTVKIVSQMFVNERMQMRSLGKALMNMFPQLRRVNLQNL